MASGGPYLFTNVTEGTLTLPRHDGTGSRQVRPGEGFYGPSYYDRYVLQGLLARQHAEIVTVAGIVQEADMIPMSAPWAGSFDAKTQSYQLPPHRFQRKASSSDPYFGSSDIKCGGLTKYTLSFPLSARADDPVSVTYYFYTSSTAPTIPTFKIQKTEVLSENWTYPTWAPLPSNFYDLAPQDQYRALLKIAP